MGPYPGMVFGSLLFFCLVWFFVIDPSFVARAPSLRGQHWKWINIIFWGLFCRIRGLHSTTSVLLKGCSFHTRNWLDPSAADHSTSSWKMSGALKLMWTTCLLTNERCTVRLWSFSKHPCVTFTLFLTSMSTLAYFSTLFLIHWEGYTVAHCLTCFMVYSCAWSLSFV